MPDTQIREQMKIFRAGEAPSLVESGCMTMEAMTEEQLAGISKLVAAGYLEGEEIRVLVDLPGFSLVHVWLKQGYPLMRHTHDTDCLYYVVAGSVHLGTEELLPRDCFFVPAGVPYVYTTGASGAEVLEFRHNGSFNFVNLTNNPGFWEKAEQTIRNNREQWQTAVPPSANFTS